MRLTVYSGAPVNADNLPGLAWNTHRAPAQPVLPIAWWGCEVLAELVGVEVVGVRH